MSEQPEALRLADELDAWEKVVCGSSVMATATIKLQQAAAELRRLHEVNQELLEALKLADALLWGANMNAVVVERKVKAAIAKATGEQA